MRYRKGSIELSPTHDAEILRLVLHARYISHEQLLRFFQFGADPILRGTFNWRVRRLVAHGLLQHENIPILGRTQIYSIGALGIEHLAGQGEFYTLPVNGSTSDPVDRSVLHSLDLNEVQLALKESGLLVSWRSETQIRSRNELTTFRYAKDYDAIVTVRSGQDAAEFALEYERTPKAKHRYDRIREALESERQVHRFLYLAANYHLLNYLTQFFRNIRKPVYFGLFQDIRQQLLDMHVADSAGIRRLPLRDALRS